MQTELPEAVRTERPKRVFRYTFTHFFRGVYSPAQAGMPRPGEHCIVPVEAAAPGDVQVLAAGLSGQYGQVAVKTNYAAEARIRAAVRAKDARLARRLEWDTEAGAVGVYAKDEADIRAVTAVIDDLVALSRNA